MEDSSDVEKNNPKIYPEKKDETETPIDTKKQKKYNDGIGGDAVASIISSAFLLFVTIKTTISLLAHKDMGGAGDVLIIAFPIIVLTTVLSIGFSSSAKKKVKQSPDGYNILKSISILVKMASIFLYISLTISAISIIILFLSY